jgi:hypothetical protein
MKECLKERNEGKTYKEKGKQEIMPESKFISMKNISLSPC